MKKKNSGKLLFASKKYCFKRISIEFIPLFDVYDLLLEHFVYCHRHMDFLACQNIDKEIFWGHEMMGCMILFILLTCA
jgi:hypothetical protein